MVRGYVPPIMAKNTSWAMKVFRDWHAERSTKASPDEECPGELVNPDVATLNFWLPRFVLEMRRQDGKPYPSRSTHQLLTGLQHYMLDKNPMATKFLDQKDPRFRDVHGACDSVYRQLHQQGIGTSVRHASVITPEEEEQLWSTSVISITTPHSLQRAVFYYVGKRFCIRGGEEQRRLGPSQLVRSSNPDL